MLAENDAVDGADDGGFGELGAGLGDAGFSAGHFGFGAADVLFAAGGVDEGGALTGGFDARLGDVELAVGGFKFSARDGAAIEQVFAAVAFGAGLFEDGAGFGDEGVGLAALLSAVAVAEAFEFGLAFVDGRFGQADAGDEIAIDQGGDDLAASNPSVKRWPLAPSSMAN